MDGSVWVVEREHVEDGVDFVGRQRVQLPRAIERLHPEDALSAVERCDFDFGQRPVRQKRLVARGLRDVA